FGTRYFNHTHGFARLGCLPFYLRDLQRTQPAVFIPEEFLGMDTPFPLTPFLMGSGGTQDHGPVWPRRSRIAPLGGFGKQFDLGDRFGSLTNGGTHAIRPGIAASDHNHIFPSGKNVFFLERRIAYPFVLLT